MSKLNISLFQSKLHWEDPAANRNSFEIKIRQLSSTDLIILPEMFTTGFSMASEQLAEETEGETFEWMKALASDVEAVICGSFIVKEDGKYYNRLIWMPPDGNYGTYDKKHLFRMADEDDHFSPGKQRPIFELKGWRICPLICYDLRFPVWSRNRFDTDRKTYAHAEYDLLLYVANWPAPRTKAWEKLLLARAIENQAYVAGLNRIGTDGKGVEYSGGSLISDARGELIWKAKDRQEDQLSRELDLDELVQFREKFPVGMDADDFELK